MTESISGYSFTPADLRVAERRPGISAFMRIRNGADFLEATIRSHIDHFDEIVALYNQCTDATPDILARLAAEFGPRLKVFHYEDRVFPPGSAGHARTDPASPNSLVNYYNAALARTSFRIATKLDDDHLAIPANLAAATAGIARLARAGDLTRMHCFSGLNLMRTTAGELAVPADDPVSGGGDIGFFPVGPETYFTHDRRFERFQRAGLHRVFCGYLYWHLKALKGDMGFGNYEIEANANSRYARRLERIKDDRPATTSLKALSTALRPRIGDRLLAAASEKKRLKLQRNAALSAAFPEERIEDAVRATVEPRFLASIGL